MKKILVAYDGGEPAHRAIEMAADLAHRFEAQVGVISVVPFHPGRVPIDPWDDRPVLGSLGRFLEGSVSEHVATHSGATVIVAR